MSLPSVNFISICLTVSPQRHSNRGTIAMCCVFEVYWGFVYYLFITTFPFNGKMLFWFKNLFQHLITPKMPVISFLWTLLGFGAKYYLNQSVFSAYVAAFQSLIHSINSLFQMYFDAQKVDWGILRLMHVT